MSGQPLGTWEFGADGRVHYFLGGVPLCGGRARDTGRPAPRSRYKYPDTSHDCPACREGCVLRWAGRDAPATT